jgi:SAM-dependent methyltransferase
VSYYPNLEGPMAFVKIWRTIQRQGARSALRKLLTLAPAYLGGIGRWRLGRCKCCERPTIFVAHRSGCSEFQVCLFCSANERYELLAAEIRERYGESLTRMDVLELDPRSPLRTVLTRARTYTRSFYAEGSPSPQQDGAVCADITALQFENESLDLIVSSDVLEHVPDLGAALRESARVLRPGGSHLFTVPPRTQTKMRAQIVGGQVQHLLPPERHLDPLSPDGILAFWDLGPDLGDALATKSLEIKIVRGPVGDAGRLVWIAQKVVPSAPHS